MWDTWNRLISMYLYVGPAASLLSKDCAKQKITYVSLVLFHDITDITDEFINSNVYVWQNVIYSIGHCWLILNDVHWFAIIIVQALAFT